MARGSHRLALDDAARALGVSTDILEKRFSAGELPEAEEGDTGITVDADDLASIADRENWVIDLRDEADERSAQFTEMLERLLTLGDRLTDEVAARRVAETEAGHAKQEVRRLTDTIEQQHAEQQRMAVDLQQAAAELAAARATADERQGQVIHLTERNNELRKQHERELSEHRAHAASLRKELTRAHDAMGWWSRRRLR